MENVGQQLLFHLQMVNELVGQLSENARIAHGYISIDAKKGVWNLTREEALDIKQQLLDMGFELTETKRETYSTEYYLVLPGLDLKFKVSHRPTEADRLEALQEKVEKAQLEYEELLAKRAEGVI